MRQDRCETCGGTFPLGTMYLVRGVKQCEACANQTLAGQDKKKIPDGSVVKQIDPTMCVKCGRDNGDADLPTLTSGLPICAGCDAKVRNPRFPFWIKAWMVGLLALAAASTAYNWRFIRGYAEFTWGVKGMREGKTSEAAALLDSAARHVPEMDEIRSMAGFFMGYDLMMKNKPEEALPHFLKARELGGGFESLDSFILSAEAGAAFDTGDYDGFLEKSRALQAANPDDPTSAGQVASALAAKWAVTGDESLRKEAYQWLSKARQLSGTDAAALLAFKEYEGRILYRIDSRRIIEKEEYDALFPSGYARKGETR